MLLWVETLLQIKKTILRFNRLAQSILQGSLLLISKWGMGVGATNANIFFVQLFCVHTDHREGHLTWSDPCLTPYEWTWIFFLKYHRIYKCNFSLVFYNSYHSCFYSFIFYNTRRNIFTNVYPAKSLKAFLTFRKLFLLILYLLGTSFLLSGTLSKCWELVLGIFSQMLETFASFFDDNLNLFEAFLMLRTSFYKLFEALLTVGNFYLALGNFSSTACLSSLKSTAQSCWPCGRFRAASQRRNRTRPTWSRSRSNDLQGWWPVALRCRRDKHPGIKNNLVWTWLQYGWEHVDYYNRDLEP